MPDDFTDHMKWNDKFHWREIMNLSKTEFQGPSGDEGACVTEDAEKEGVSHSKMNSSTVNGRKNAIRQFKAQDLRRMIYNAKHQTNEFTAVMAEAKDPRPKDPAVWEVYVGRRRVSEEISKKKHCLT